MFRTFSSYVVIEMEKMIEEGEANDRFGWLYEIENAN